MGLSFPRHIAAGAALALLGACGVPQDVAEERQIIAGADAPDASFAVQVVSRATLPMLASWPHSHPTPNLGWITRQATGSEPLIAPGDKLNLTIWDNDESSLLSSPTQKQVNLADLAVSSKGTVFLPYAGEVYVAEQTPDQARQTIQDKLLTIIPTAQVQLAFASGRQNSVELVSGVSNPGVYPLENRATTITTLLAQGGGIPSGTNNPQIMLSRGGKLYRTSAEVLMANPALDTTLRGGDKVFVEADDRYFLALGAAGKESILNFPHDTISALDAMALMGGVNQTTANPKGILILRNYPESALRSDGKGPSKDRMVFVLDLTTADGLFSAGEFGIQNRDLVLVTQSNLVNTRTVMSLIGSVLGLSNQFESTVSN
jgi:polysaccharide export outer membrane protein